MMNSDECIGKNSAYGGGFLFIEKRPLRLIGDDNDTHTIPSHVKIKAMKQSKSTACRAMRG